MRRLAVLFALFAALAVAVSAQAADPSVHRYQTGQKVRNLQWLLQGYPPSIYKIVAWHHPRNGIYDLRLKAAVRNMRWRIGYPVSALDGDSVDPTFIGYLKGKRRPFSYRLTAGKRVIMLAKRRHELEHPPVSARVKLLVNDANYLISRASLIGYTQDTRRMAIVREHLRLPPLTRFIYEDCSSAITGLYWLAAGGSSSTPHPTGLPDPNGYTSPPFNGSGYTGTLATHGRVVWRLGQSLGLLRPGDLILYAGGFPFRHVTMYKGNGRVFSHGTATGPFDLPALYRADAVEARRYVQ